MSTRCFNQTILFRDTQITKIEYFTNNDYCIYNKYDQNNKSEHVINILNNKFKTNYSINKHYTKTIVDVDTIYGGNIDIYMNNIINTEVWARFLKPSSKIITIPLCLYIDNPWNENFAHLIFELLYPLIKMSAIDNNLPILMAVGDYTQPLLKILGINNPIIKREEHNVYRIENAIYIGSIEAIEQKQMLYVKKYIDNKISHLKENVKKPKGVVICRTNQRIIYNYKQFIEKLNLKYDFIDWVTYDEHETIDEYLPKFINCSYIIGSHGAGHANMIFSQCPDLKIFEFMINNFTNACFKNMAEALHFEFHTLFLDNDKNLNTTLDIDAIIDSLNPYITHVN